MIQPDEKIIRKQSHQIVTIDSNFGPQHLRVKVHAALNHHPSSCFTVTVEILVRRLRLICCAYDGDAEPDGLEHFAAQGVPHHCDDVVSDPV